MADEMQAPHRFSGDAVELRNLIVDHTPNIVQNMGSLIGFDPRRFPKKAEKEFARRIHAGFGPMLPFLAMEAHEKGEISDLKFAYIKTEALMRAYFAVAGRRIAPEKDACAYVLELSRQAANPYLGGLSRRKSYRNAKSSVDAFAEAVAGTLLERFEDVQAEWLKAPETRKHMAFLRGWMNEAVDFQDERPKRFSERTIERIANSYRSFASFWESRLRFVVALQRAMDGKPASPELVRKIQLAQLIESVAKDPHLSILVSRFNRHVRNALAHGRPDWDRARNLVVFHDRSKNIEWTCGEFWVQTQELLIGALALAMLEFVVRWKTNHLFYGAFWQALREEQESKTKTTPAPK